MQNGIVTGASGVSVAYISMTQPTDFNSFSSEFYKGPPGNVTITIGKLLSSYVADWTTSLTTEDTRIVLSTISTDLTADFGLSANSIKVFTTQTFYSTYQRTTTRSTGNFGTTTSVKNNSTTVPFHGYTSTTTEFSTYYLDSSTAGYQSITYCSSYLTMTDFAHLVGFSSTSSALNNSKTVKFTSFLSKNLPRSVSWTGGHITAGSTRSFVTFNKGRQGGIQYESASDISDAVRSFYPVTVADQKLTTSTMTSPAATIDLSVNSAQSNSYLSGLLPLGLNISLNRYMPFLPMGGYRSIFSTVGGSDSPSNYVLDYEEDGSSIVFLTSTGEYLTSGASGSIVSETSRTVQTFSSVLNGLAKVQQGQAYDNGKKTIAQVEAFDFIHGGQKFTDREGLVIYSTQSPPISFYLFGPSSSSLVTQESTDIVVYNRERTSSLPAHSVIFAPTATFLLASNSIVTYDRYQ